MKEYILCCSCHRMDKLAKESFCLLTGGTQELPEIIKGRDRLYKFGKDLDNDHIIAISKLSGKFAYYVELNDENIIAKEVNLLNGRRIG